MAELVDMLDKIKRYYRFTSYELRGLVISVLVMAFVFSYNDWGPGNTFIFSVGSYNFFNAILIVTLSILVHDLGQRLWALASGYRLEFKMWSFGLILSLVAALLTRGTLPLIIPAGFMLHHLAGHRLGWFRYGINYFGQAMVALAGPLFTLMLIILLKVLNSFFPNPLIHKAIIFNVVYAITSLLPIPPLDGSKIYFGSRMLYAFVLPAIAFATILMIIDIPIFFALVLSLLVGIILWLVYYISFERKVWAGPK
ncbi:hypothetical protein HYX03_04820 [Candidatus Woesearchaeota archaeon]|nr:hypothetical protein [Candidatus Woesearchaeota archaeon]